MKQVHSENGVLPELGWNTNVPEKRKQRLFRSEKRKKDKFPEFIMITDKHLLI